VLLSLALVWTGLSATACGAFAVVTGSHGPCWFDPPPGDMGAIRIVDDTPQAVTLVDCLDRACSQGENPQAVAARAGTDWTYELCSGWSVGVRSRSGVLLGCLVLPVGEPAAVTALAVSQASRCQATVD